ncbi:MAG TPA: hypothetical protein VKG25_01020 [Bryobacteraceae bacterium]|nr:hypothetical protein [Bryobacteraceae bacterium]
MNQIQKAQIEKAIEDFVREARRPCLCEPGEHPIALTSSNFQIAACGSGLLIEAWDETQNLTRRVTGIDTRPERGRLILSIEKFGKKAGTLALIDQASAAQQPAGVRHRRQEFLRRFERFLRRQFPAYSLDELSTSPDLHESLSPFFPRALLRIGTTAWAAIGAPADPLRTDGVLSFGLIWLDYLKRREPGLRVAGLILYLPAELAQATCLRLAFLDHRNAQYRPFVYTQDGEECETDPADHGNLDTRLELASTLETNHLARPSNVTVRRPEAWLESQVRKNIEVLNPRLLPRPVYGQVPAFTAADRGVMDLLAADSDGRLAIIELKASEDLHLPLQALDYWLRVKWHLDRREFARNGYFPGVALRTTPPKLLLVSPALDVHPTNERVLRYFSPEVEVERVGISVEWRKKLRVVFRMAQCH